RQIALKQLRCPRTDDPLEMLERDRIEMVRYQLIKALSGKIDLESGDNFDPLKAYQVPWRVTPNVDQEEVRDEVRDLQQRIEVATRRQRFRAPLPAPVAHDLVQFRTGLEVG